MTASQVVVGEARLEGVRTWGSPNHQGVRTEQHGGEGQATGKHPKNRPVERESAIPEMWQQATRCRPKGPAITASGESESTPWEEIPTGGTSPLADRQTDRSDIGIPIGKKSGQTPGPVRYTSVTFGAH